MLHQQHIEHGHMAQKYLAMLLRHHSCIAADTTDNLCLLITCLHRTLQRIASTLQSKTVALAHPFIVVRDNHERCLFITRHRTRMIRHKHDTTTTISSSQLPLSSHTGPIVLQTPVPIFAALNGCQGAWPDAHPRLEA